MQTSNFNSPKAVVATTSLDAKVQKASYLIPFVLVISLFFMWGMAGNLNDILIKQFKKTFELTDFQSGLVQSAFYMGYFLFAIPASLVMRRFNYKSGIIIGLLLYATGAFLFFPAANLASYGFFLFALFVIASGLAFLETAANPYVSVLGAPETATFRLNLAQSFNPIGCVTGILVGQHFIFSGVEYSKEQLAAMAPEAIKAYHQTEALAVQTPYLVIGMVILIAALAIAITKFPTVKDEEVSEQSSAKSTLKFIFGKRHFKQAVLAQFFYVGAQVCIWSYLIRYIQGTMPGTPEKVAANFLTISLVVFTIGRFVGTALLKKIKGHNLLGLYAVMNVALLIVGILLPGNIGAWMLVATSFFMSIMYPTIFSLGIRDLGQHTKLASSVLVMAIIGGATLTMLMGAVSDLAGIANSLIVPLLCFVFIAFYALKGYKEKVESNSHLSSY
ncbi:L-fucose:H+ symporter permease [Paludibacter jiangxiensis]|uniref:MFS transporter, FHS family n=1 Tax=Paludibacter jiangxiensis TaxID=681398 RepID=A0A170ZXF7_9BACT|nr:L-fucose:H+ symporter permease [Paludibacter jiangxiensis]GAT63111.1 MFS transporter, FHS family [Paludibacter jiangxiensis]